MNNKRYDKKGKLLRKGERQKKENLYTYRWTDANGKRQEIYASTLSELREKEEQIELEQIFKVTRSSDTLDDMIERYLKTKVTLAKSTKENYKYYYNHSVKNSWLGKSRIIDIKKSDILMFYSELTNENNYSAGTIKILHRFINPALQLAVDDGLLMKNPAYGCTKDYSEDMEKKYALALEEEAEFLDRILNRPRMKRYYPFYAILLKIGLRISEAVGLTWDDIDFKNKTISINHQVQFRQINGTYTCYASKPKTKAGIRIIPMTDEVYELFKLQREEWLKIKKDPDFEVDGYSNFVFLSHVNGRCLQPNNVRRMMRTIVAMNEEREVQLPDISPHILRHTACVRLAESGCDIKVLQYVLGQSDIRTTMRVYNHANSDRARREFARLQGKDVCTPICTPIATKVM